MTLAITGPNMAKADYIFLAGIPGMILALLLENKLKIKLDNAD